MTKRRTKPLSRVDMYWKGYWAGINSGVNAAKQIIRRIDINGLTADEALKTVLTELAREQDSFCLENAESSSTEDAPE